MTNRNVGVYDFIMNIMEGKEMDEGKKHNFLIVCGGNPCKNKFNSAARVVYVQLQDVKTNKVTYVMPDELAEFVLEWIKLTDNRTRKIGGRKTDFTVLGNTIEEEFPDTKFFEYSYGVIRGANVKVVNAIKEKCEIHDVVEFKGVEQTIAIPEME